MSKHTYPMQTNYKSLADIKKRVPTINDIQSNYKYTPRGAAKQMKHDLSLADAWIYRIVIIALSAAMLKLVISTCFN